MSTPDTSYLGGDPAISSRFLFEVDGVEIGLFSSVRGLAVATRTHEIREGGQNGYVHKLPGRMEWPTIVFSRGLTQSDALFTWMNRTSGQQFAANGDKLVRSTGAITAMSADGIRLRTWSLEAVYPVRWKGPDFDGSNDSMLSEELEVAHHGFTAANVQA